MSFNNQSKIAFLGMGLMGSRMATRLLDAGYQVAVWNRTETACLPLLKLGAELLQFEKLAEYSLLLLCLADDDAVQNVYDQIHPHLTAQQVVLDFSSLSVDKTQALAKKAASISVQWIDCPVSGGIAGAENGSLVIFAGGDAATIQQLDQLYSVIAQRVTRMGETGTGQATKICNQLIVAANSSLIAEAVALARQAGVDAALLAPALEGGFADSKPLQILAPRMAAQVFEPVQWKVQTLSKDLNNALKLAAQFNLNIPVAAQAFSQLCAHQAQGHAEDDLATIIQHVEA